MQPRFTFGLWTVANPGRDPFGEPVRAPVDPVDTVHRLADIGAWGVSLHDDDLIPWGTPLPERERIIARFKQALAQTGIGVGMATTNLFSHPAAKDPRDALARYAEAIDVLGDYVVEQGYDLRFAIEPKPNEPRGDIFLPTVGHALHFITMLQRPEMVGVNPEFAHENMAGLSFHQGVGQALWAGKLFHIDLNAQRIGRYDQDFRFGAEDLKEAFHLVRLLERSGYDGPRHFDAHAYRTEDADGVWDFARGCISTYRTLAEKAVHFDALPEVQEALATAGATDLGTRSIEGADTADALKAEGLELDVLGARGYGNERLDQLVIDVLLGVC
jgi:xylose isomerase